MLWNSIQPFWYNFQLLIWVAPKIAQNVKPVGCEILVWNTAIKTYSENESGVTTDFELYYIMFYDYWMNLWIQR